MYCGVEPLMRNVITILLACATALFLAWRGIYPALTAVETDFPNYYTAARLLTDGRDIDSLYHDKWFQEQMAGYGINVQGKFSPFPPPTVFVMLPLAHLDVLTAQRVWTVLNILLTALLVSLMAQLLGWSRRSAWILLGLSGLAIANNFRFGQFYLVVAVAMTYSYMKWRSGKILPVGLLTGLVGVIKYFPFISMIQPLLRREFRVVAICSITVLSVVAVSAWALGWDVFRDFLSGAIGQHVAGNIQNPYVSTFQSFGSLARRLFLDDPVLNPAPLVASTTLYYATHHGLTVIVLVCVAVGIKRTKWLEFDQSTDLQYALLAVGGLLASPATGTYHMLLVVPAIGLILKHSADHRGWNIFFATTYACIGFIPYSFFSRFDGHGIATVLAYPRLVLLTVLFVGILGYIFRLPRVQFVTHR